MRLRLGWILWVGIKRVKVKPQTLHTDSWIKTEQVDVTCFIISLFNAQHVLNVSISILRSLRLICWVISWVVLLWFDVCWCYGVVRLGWCGILTQAEALIKRMTSSWSIFIQLFISNTKKYKLMIFPEIIDCYSVDNTNYIRPNTLWRQFLKPAGLIKRMTSSWSIFIQLFISNIKSTN